MKKTALFLLLTMCVQTMVFCQQNNLQVNYGRLQNQNYIVNPYLQSNVVSDYGMRIAPGAASRFHRGIDYKPNNYTIGDAIVSITNGTIMKIVAPNSVAKYIVIQIDGTNQYFAYLHIFEDGALPMSRGQFRIQYLPSPNNSVPVIIDLVNGTAFASIPNISFTSGNNNYITTNRVALDQVIAPIGTSGNVGAHVHVSLLEQNVSPSDQNYSIDAWNLIAHAPTVLETRIRSRRVLNDDYHITECEANHTEPGFRITQQTGRKVSPRPTPYCASSLPA
jgi:murein DD-endopeptidase MepM/ murein hydrolase activator NlpD